MADSHHWKNKGAQQLSRGTPGAPEARQAVAVSAGIRKDVASVLRV